MKKKEINKNIVKSFKAAGIKISEIQGKQFTDLYELILKYNKEFDLTRITNFNDVVIKHFIDSIYITKFINLPSPLLDIGTGAGFPGTPLTIIKPDLEIILAEPRYKRVAFLRIVIEQLKLENVTIYSHLVTANSFFHVNGIITRALESIDATLSRVSHFLPLNGKVIFMKGPKSKMDIDSISQINKNVYELEDDIPYKLPGTSYERRLLVFNKRDKSIKKTYKIFINSNETVGLPIKSKDNNKYKQLKKLTTIEGIKQSKKTIVAGKKLIKDLIFSKKIVLNNLIIYDGLIENDNSLNEIIFELEREQKVIILKKSLYNDIDTFKTTSPLLVVNTPELKEWDYKLDQGCNLAISFQDPANVGTVIRSAAGFNLKKIIMLKEAANPYHPKSIRSSGGAVLNTEILKGPSIEEICKISMDYNINIIGLDKNGTDISGFNFPDSFLLLPGIEGPGIPEYLKEKSVSIPISNKIESFNTAIAASIVMYEWAKGK